MPDAGVDDLISHFSNAADETSAFYLVRSPP